MLALLKKRWYLVALIIVIGIIFYVNKQRSTQVLSAKSTPYTVKKEVLNDTISLSGKVAAEEDAVLQFQSAGRLAWVGVKVGDEVKQYQAIASLDKKDLQNRLNKYLNTYMGSRWSFDQAQDNNSLDSKNGLTEAQKRSVKRLADQSQFSLDSSVLDVELQNLMLQYATLTTPISGIVVRADSPLPGVNIVPAQAAFEVINPATIYFSATADQTDVVKLRESMSGELVFDAYPENTFSGAITSIAFTPKTDESGTVYEVKIAFDKNADASKYRLGMTGDVNFILSHKTVVAIPKKYIFNEVDKKYILKKVNNKPEKVYITTGDVQEDLTEVTKGLEEGDIIYD